MLFQGLSFVKASESIFVGTRKKKMTIEIAAEESEARKE
jgi:hypothetical protein